MGQKTAGFMGVAPGFLCGAMDDPEDEAGCAVQAMGINDFHTTGSVNVCDPACDWGCDSTVGMRSRADAAQWAVPDGMDDACGRSWIRATRRSCVPAPLLPGPA